MTLMGHRNKEYMKQVNYLTFPNKTWTDLSSLRSPKKIFW